MQSVDFLAQNALNCKVTKQFFVAVVSRFERAFERILVWMEADLVRDLRGVSFERDQARLQPACAKDLQSGENRCELENAGFSHL